MAVSKIVSDLIFDTEEERDRIDSEIISVLNENKTSSALKIGSILYNIDNRLNSRRVLEAMYSLPEESFTFYLKNRSGEPVAKLVFNSIKPFNSHYILEDIKEEVEGYGWEEDQSIQNAISLLASASSNYVDGWAKLLANNDISKQLIYDNLFKEGKESDSCYIDISNTGINELSFHVACGCFEEMENF